MKRRAVAGAALGAVGWVAPALTACTVDVAPVAFGVVDTLRQSRGTGEMVVRCDSNASFQVGISPGGAGASGTRRMSGPDGARMDYYLFSDPATRRRGAMAKLWAARSAAAPATARPRASRSTASCRPNPTYPRASMTTACRSRSRSEPGAGRDVDGHVMRMIPRRRRSIRSV
jgi:hypothetical protein